MFGHLPVLRQTQFFPGQLGVPGSDTDLGIRAAPGGVVLYVDENHPGATATNDGTDPLNPLTTITAAIAKPYFTAGSVIVVGANATLVESVTIPATAPQGCSIIGVSNGTYMPTWTAAAGAGTALTINQRNWRISGIKFNIPATGIAIQLNWTATLNGSETLIDHCQFMGGYAGHFGIVAAGAPYAVHIEDCEFAEILDGARTGFAIFCANAPIADPLMWRIERCVFWDVDNAIGSSNHDYGFNTSIIKDNLFYDGEGIPTVIKLDLRGGSLGHNIVTGNFFSGDYSNVGGYYDSGAQASEWMGNLSPDLAEAGVGDNGWTILPPA